MKIGLYFILFSCLLSFSLKAQNPYRNIANGDANDNFGKSVAVDGNYLIVGAPGDGIGSAYIYNVTTGSIVHTLNPSDGVGGLFGQSVSISGQYAVVGAPGHTSSTGAVYVYDVSTGSQLRMLTASDGENGDNFGGSVSISGTNIIIGAYGDEGNIGSAYVFDASTGNEMSKLYSDSGAADDYFGCSVSIDGNYALVGAYWQGSGKTYPGRAYIFDLSDIGNITRTQLSPFDGASDDFFGASVSVSGGYAIIGAYADDDNGSSSGSAYIYNVTTGAYITKITANDGSADDCFGTSVDISGDYVLVGASGVNGNTGSVYVFEVGGSWGQLNKLNALDGSTNDFFGCDVACADAYAIIGAYGDDNNGSESGSVYIVDYSLPAMPSTQATNITFSSITSSSATVSWTRGDGENCAVFMFLGDEGTVTPDQFTTYTANTTFALGTQIGSTGWYCVYNGNGASVSVSGLETLTYAYQVQIFEYNGSAGSEVYLTDINGTNPAELKDFVSWLGVTTDWYTASNWSEGSVPTFTDNVVIPAQSSQPGITNTYASGAEVANLTISTGAVLTINASSALTVNGDLSNDGSIILAANATANDRSGALITIGSVTNNGTMTLNRNVSGNTIESNDYSWHTLGLPIESSEATAFFTGDYMYEYAEGTNSWSNVVSGIVNRGQGYLVKTISGDNTYAFTGTFNSGNYSYDLINTGPDADHGYNLISNPYPSQIDIRDLTLTNISYAYLWNPATETYLFYEIGTTDGNTMNPIVESCQGFFVKVSNGSATGNVTFTNGARVVSDNGGLLKSALVSAPKVSFKVTKDHFEDVLVVKETDKVNEGYKLFSMNADAPQIYASDNVKDYCVYNMSQVQVDDIIPVGFKSNVSGKYTIDVTEQSFGDFDVYLVDKIDKNNPQEYPIAQGASFEIDHDAANSEDRFEIVFKQTGATDVDDNIESNINIYSRDNGIIINSETKFSYTIYSVSGDIIKMDAEKIGEENIQVNPGIYIVKVTSDKGVETRKVLVK